MQLILQQCLPERLLHFPLAGDSLLPAVKADDAHDAVDLADDLLDDGGRGLGARFLEEFGQGGFGLPPLIFRFDALFGLHGFLRNREQLLEVFEAGDEALLQPFFDLLQTLPQRHEDRIVAVLPQARDDLDLQFFRFLLIVDHLLQEVGVDDERIEIVAHGFDVDVFVDEVERLRAEGVPQQFAVTAGRPDRFIHLRQPAIVVFVAAQNRIGRERFPQLGQHGIIGGEGIAPIVVGQARLRGDQAFVAADGSIETGEVRQALRQRAGQIGLQAIEVGDDVLHRFLVEVQRARHVVEDADVVHDQAVGLAGKRSVGAADRLQQVVFLHRLVEIHRLQDRRVETREQARGDDEELERIERVAEAIEQLLFVVFAALDTWRATRPDRPAPTTSRSRWLRAAALDRAPAYT